jgi:hypothetical protein
MTVETPTSYFRFYETCVETGYTDWDGDFVSTGSYVKLDLQEFEVIKNTPKGVRINDYSQTGRFISREWNKQWASPTVEETRLSFIARKKRQACILEAQLRQAYAAMELAEQGFVSKGDESHRNSELLPKEVPWLLGHRPDWSQRART